MVPVGSLGRAKKLRGRWVLVVFLVKWAGVRLMGSTSVGILVGVSIVPGQLRVLIAAAGLAGKAPKGGRLSEEGIMERCGYCARKLTLAGRRGGLDTETGGAVTGRAGRAVRAVRGTGERG